ncbi:hypothetical protein [Streptomyces olivochromogenes]|uniref:hypothetical protein n=1 Tax=Streptomyces olivochromogenes TaxID=1963 RepID=UPI0007495521|nr:hypothetical protein [Streptomyces olivochromogenes]KUN43391.1 hypothetical protein AQJ27_30375 [Streptomyces olivochromogenes]
MPKRRGEDGTQPLPDTRTACYRQFTHGRLMFEEVTRHHVPEPATGEAAARRVLRLIAGFVGLAAFLLVPARP